MFRRARITCAGSGGCMKAGSEMSAAICGAARVRRSPRDAVFRIDERDGDRAATLRDIAVRWLAPVPAEAFWYYRENPLDDDLDYLDDGNFSDRYIKTVFMSHMKAAAHPCDVADLLKRLSCDPDGEVTPLEIFLCSESSLENRRYTRELTGYASDGVSSSDGAGPRSRLTQVYSEIGAPGDDFCGFVLTNGMNRLPVGRSRVSVRDRLKKPEYDLLSGRADVAGLRPQR